MWARADTTGLDGMMNACFADPTCSNYRMTGYTKLDQPARMLLGVAAFSTVPVEHFIFKMMDDDRLLLHARETHAEVVKKMQSTTQLPDLLWDRMSKSVRCEPHEYMHQTLFSMAISYGFLWDEVYEFVETDPLRLTQGDIQANVMELAETREAPQDPIAARIKDALDEGLEPPRVVGALTDLKEAPMSTKLSEEAHALGAVLKAQRKHLNEKQLRVRCLLAAYRPTVRRNKLSLQLASIDRQLAWLAKQKSGQIHGRRMFFKQKVKEARGLWVEVASKVGEEHSAALALKEEYGKLEKELAGDATEMATSCTDMFNTTAHSKRQLNI